MCRLHFIEYYVTILFCFQLWMVWGRVEMVNWSWISDESGWWWYTSSSARGTKGCWQQWVGHWLWRGFRWFHTLKCNILWSNQISIKADYVFPFSVQHLFTSHVKLISNFLETYLPSQCVWNFLASGISFHRTNLFFDTHCRHLCYEGSRLQHISQGDWRNL